MDRRTFLKTMAVVAGSTAAYPALRLAHAQAQQFAIPPTVHHLTENSATIYFWLAQPTQKGILQITANGETVQEIPFTAPLEDLRVQLVVDGLAAATQYEYAVLLDGAVPSVTGLETMWTGLSFRTPPYEWPLRVAAIGDSGFGDTTTRELAAHLAQQNPDLFLHLGDVVYWMHEYDNDPFVNWNIKYFSPFQETLRRAPHYATFGNHEQDGPARVIEGVPSYYWMFPPFDEQQQEGQRLWYSFDYNGIQFISLNSQLFYSLRALHSEQTAWLTERLARTDVLYNIVFCHVSPYTSAAPHQWDGMYIAEQWSPLFEAANVPLVISGHAHVYERLHRNGVNYIVAGSGSSTIYYQGEKLASSQVLWLLPSYPLFEFYEDRIHLTTFNQLGEKIDELDLPLRT